MSEAAALATSDPTRLAHAADEAIATASAGIATLKAGTLHGLDLLDAYDEAVAALKNAADRMSLISVTHPDPAMRDAAEAAKQKIDKVRTEISLDRGVYEALRGLDLSSADAPTRPYVSVILRDFRRAGVDRDEATRQRVRELRDELVALGQDFTRNIRSDTRTLTLAPTALAGLPEDYVRAHPPGDDGMVRITTDYPDLVPFLTYATDAHAREQLWRLSRQRGYPANVDVLKRILQRRHELATLLGYPNWAQYAAEDKMIGSADNIAAFIDRVASAAEKRCRSDYEQLLARKRADEPEAHAVYPWDVSYLDDRIKAEQFALDTRALREYFEYGRVKAGLMRLIERLFAIEFRQRDDIPVWHPEVECHDVFATDGRLLGRIFLDMHPRPDKYNHAAMFAMTTGKAGVRLPECALVCNLPRPGAQPALMQYSDVRTVFHEFGHLIHHILGGHTRWSGTSGLATEWDFVEAPSQLLEEWIRDAETLATFAVHHRTGEVLPADMVARLRAAEEFGKGVFVCQQMFYATVSFELHRRHPAGLDPLAVEREAQQRLTPFPHVEGTHFYAGFGHLEGYTALYCTYMWSLVIAKDLFTVFARDGLLSETAAARYRDTVLAPGGSAPAAELVENFLGRPYDVAAFQAWLQADQVTASGSDR